MLDFYQSRIWSCYFWDHWLSRRVLSYLGHPTSYSWYILNKIVWAQSSLEIILNDKVETLLRPTKWGPLKRIFFLKEASTGRSRQGAASVSHGSMADGGSDTAEPLGCRPEQTRLRVVTRPRCLLMLKPNVKLNGWEGPFIRRDVKQPRVFVSFVPDCLFFNVHSWTERGAAPLSIFHLIDW